jgi:hypothetical protein
MPPMLWGSARLAFTLSTNTRRRQPSCSAITNKFDALDLLGGIPLGFVGASVNDEVDDCLSGVAADEPFR